MSLVPSDFLSGRSFSLVDLTFNTISGPELVRFSEQFENRVRTVTCCALYNITHKHFERFFANVGSTLTHLTLSTLHQPWLDLRKIPLDLAAPRLKLLHTQQAILHPNILQHPTLEDLKLARCVFPRTPPEVTLSPSLQTVECVACDIPGEHLTAQAPSSLSTLYLHAPTTERSSFFHTLTISACPLTMMALDAPTIRRISFLGDLRYLYYARLGSWNPTRRVDIRHALHLQPFVLRQLQSHTAQPLLI